MTKTIDTPIEMTEVPTTNEKLGLVARLTFTENGVGHNSNKFHNSLLLGNVIVYRFGKVGTTGQTGEQIFETAEKAAAKYWGLLREKIGKGYHVDTAKVIPVSDLRVGGSPGHRFIVVDWESIAPIKEYGIGHPEKLGLSPRTPKQGASVFLTLTSINPDKDALIACALTGSSERFLLPMVLSHPACPKEAQVIGTLIKMGANIAG